MKMVIKFKWMYGCFESLHLKTHCCYSTDLDRDNIQWPIHLHTHSFRPGPDLQTLRPQCKYELWISIETPSYTPQSHCMYQLWSVNNQSTVRVKSLYPHVKNMFIMAVFTSLMISTELMFLWWNESYCMVIYHPADFVTFSDDLW